MRRWIPLLALLSLGCSADVEVDGDEPTSRIDVPVWGEGEVTELGLRVPVCIPMGDQCLRMRVLINTQERIDEATATGQLVDHGCAADAAPIATVETFHGSAYTGHGMLWLDGSTTFGDGSSLDLVVEAEMGDCR